MYIPPWSASSVDAYMTCPHKFYRLRVARDVKDFPPSDAVVLGRKLHKAFENAVNLNEPLPESCAQWQSLVEIIKALPGEKLPEYDFTLDEFHTPKCHRSLAWTRGIADLIVKRGTEAIILDYKTGKRKPSEQLALYAAYAFAYWPELQTVHTCFVWLKDRKMDKKTYRREDAAGIWQYWLPLVARMRKSYETGDWPCRPSGLCKSWCPVTDCKFQGK